MESMIVDVNKIRKLFLVPKIKLWGHFYGTIMFHASCTCFLHMRPGKVQESFLLVGSLLVGYLLHM